VAGVAACDSEVENEGSEEGYYPPYDPDGDGIDVGDIQQAVLAWRETCP